MSFTLSLERPKDPQIAQFNLDFAQTPRAEVFIEKTGYRFLCRPGTTDLHVLFDTFQGLFHLPPVRLPPEALIVDLGSNIGATMLHYGMIYPMARIIGVELDHENALLAAENIAVLGDRAALVHAAVWNEDRIVSYGGEEAWGLMVDPSGIRRVRGITMPTLYATFGIRGIDFLKVDIEGAERELFSGDLSWLLQVASLYIEVHHGQPLMDSLLELFNTTGFNAWKDARHPWGVVAVRKRTPG